MAKKFSNGYFDGLWLVFDSMGFIARNRLSHVYIYIILIGIAVSSLSITGVKFMSDWLSDNIGDIINIVEWPDFFKGVLSVLMKVIGWLGGMLVWALVGGYIVILLLSPVFSMVAEKTLSVITGTEFKFNLGVFLRSVLRGIIVTVRNSFFQFALAFILFLFGLVPVVGIAAVVLTFMVNAFFYGYSMIDYSYEAMRFAPAHSMRRARKNLFAIIGMGTPYALLILIPWVGVYLAMFMLPPIIVAGARFTSSDIDANGIEG